MVLQFYYLYSDYKELIVITILILLHVKVQKYDQRCEMLQIQVKGT